jgi:hypothetical protein
LRCGKLSPRRVLDASVRHGLRLFLNFGGRAFGQLRHRPRIRLGGRCEPEQGGAGNRRQPKLSRINRSRWRGRFLASRSECHGDRRERRGGDPAYGGYRAIRSAFGGAHVAMRKRRRRSSRSRGRTFSAARPAANHLAHAGARIPIYWNDYFDRRGNSVEGDATSLVTGPWRLPPDLEKKVAAGGRRAECVQK